jgi:hypothetical protein
VSGSLDDARAWMQDGDRLRERASRRITDRHGAAAAGDLDIATHDYGRAAELYLTGAVAYQHGDRGVEASAGTLGDTRRLVESLDGRLRSEADAAWRGAQRDRADDGDARTRLESGRAFADALRERFAHAAPELFDRGAQAAPAREPSVVRGR